MTLRLVVLFALVSIVTFAGVGGYLYHCLHARLEVRDDDELLGKSGALAHLVQEAASLQAISDNRHALLDIISGHDQLLVRVTDAAGRIIFTNDGRARIADLGAGALPASSFNVIQSAPPSAGAARFVVSRSTTRLGEQATITVARTSSDRMQLLAQYRTEVWTAASIGTLVATLLGFFFVRNGLRPLRLMATQAHAISAKRLDTRLDIRHAPRELHEIIAAFNAMLDRLHHSFEQLGRFSADLAHDLRTPVNNLMVQTQVALGKPRSIDEYQALLGSNIEEYERLARMMESMLFLARAENAHVALQIQAVDLAEELARIADYFEGVAEEAGVRLLVFGSGQVNADTILLRRAIGNLVANAIRHTPAQGVIRIEAFHLAHATLITVSNPGQGIDPAMLERVFDRFYRADPSRNSAGGSSGLGLAIVRSIMTLHHGSAGVTSMANERTVFSLCFPSGAPAPGNSVQGQAVRTRR